MLAQPHEMYPDPCPKSSCPSVPWLVAGQWCNLHLHATLPSRWQLTWICPMHEGLKAQHATFENIWGATKSYTYLWQAIKCRCLAPPLGWDTFLGLLTKGTHLLWWYDKHQSCFVRVASGLLAVDIWDGMIPRHILPFMVQLPWMSTQPGPVLISETQKMYQDYLFRSQGWYSIHRQKQRDFCA